MKYMIHAVAAVAAIAVFTLISTQTQAMDMDAHAAHGSAAHGKTGAPSVSVTAPADARALDDAMMRMHEGMAKPHTGDADADFIRGMIPHHQGAIDMAMIVLQYGDDPEAKKLARRIIKAQKGEIAWMRRWLERRQIPENGSFQIRE